MVNRRKINYIRSTKDPNIFKLSFIDRGKRVVIKKHFNHYSEAVDWLEAEELRIEERKWEDKNGN